MFTSLSEWTSEAAAAWGRPRPAESIYMICARGRNGSGSFVVRTPNLPTNIVPTNIAWLKLSASSPMGLGSPPLRISY